MTHPDPDPLDVTRQYPPLVTPASPTRIDPMKPYESSPLTRFREQRRRSRWGCGVVVLAAVGFWVALALVVHAVVAAPSEGSQPAEAPVRPSQQVASVTVGTLRGAPTEREARPSWLSPDRHDDGAPLPPVYTGKLGYALPSHGSRYLAIRWPRGTVATLCGPADCVTRASTDFGPVRSLWEKGRLADLSAVDWQRVCGVPLRFGLCSGTLLIVSRPRALPETDLESIATSGFGMHGAPRLSMSATCRNSGHQAVWVAQTGTASLDIIQVGTMDGEFFYAYGRGIPNGIRSLYVEEHLGPSGTGPHRYGLSLASRVWTLTIDGRVVATVPDTFRKWRLRATQVMAEGDLPFGAASCSFPVGSWTYGGYGPQPPNSFGATSWRVTT